MTKKELNALVEKKMAERNSDLTENDVLEIGIAHRQLLKAERNWGELAKKINWTQGGESLRNFVLRRLRNSGMVSKPVDLNNEESLVQKRQELFKEKQQVRDEWSTLNRMMREEARIDTLKEVITTAAKGMQPFKKVKYSGKKCADVEAIAMLSDLHIGVEFDDFCNKYNLDIAEQRVSKYIDDVKKYCALHKVKRLNIVNLGDMISGIIHTTIRIEQQFDVMTQVIKAGEIVAGVLNELQDAAPEVIYRSCTDNHARAIANKNEHIEKENFNRLIDWWVEPRLANTNVKFVRDGLNYEIGKFDLLNGKKVMFAHGHNDNTNKVFQNFIGATEEYINYVLLGHYHQEKVKNFQNMRVFINGSIVGTDDYAASKRYYTKPSQMLLVFDEDNVIHYSINLDI